MQLCYPPGPQGPCIQQADGGAEWERQTRCPTCCPGGQGARITSTPFFSVRTSSVGASSSKSSRGDGKSWCTGSQLGHTQPLQPFSLVLSPSPKLWLWQARGAQAKWASLATALYPVTGLQLLPSWGQGSCSGGTPSLAPCSTLLLKPVFSTCTQGGKKQAPVIWAEGGDKGRDRQWPQ